jgi:hypothetical protein
VHPSDTLLHDAAGLLEHAGVLLIDPVGEVPPVVQNLEHKAKGRSTKQREGVEMLNGRNKESLRGDA